LIREAIILAGGLGTRLRDAVPDLPKCMAPVAGHPFLYYIIRYLESQGVNRFVFSLGYRHDVIEEFLRTHFPTLNYACVIEPAPLQTGGAIKLALTAAESDDVLVMNGDTLFKVALKELEAVHLLQHAECTLALKPMNQFDRYGAVTTNDDGRIVAFEEKKFLEAGNINGGVYLLNKRKFLAQDWPDVFSFESDYLQRDASTKLFFGVIQYRYFIDIGIPEDFNQAQVDLKHFPFAINEPDHTWTLFLDRDGVINVNKDDSYVFNREEFIFKEGTLEAIARLSGLFGRIIVITNQRGVGKGLMSEADLEDIHAYMKSNIELAGGRIDDIFYCTSTDNAHPDRKPSPGMAFRAQEKYPDIDFSKSVMVGDKSADMEWGRNIGALTVLIRSERYKDTIDPSTVDIACDSLYVFAHQLQHLG
jgi:D-glycero-alpha-D-manno-heptose 1-phosphate guanylyltransferase